MVSSPEGSLLWLLWVAYANLAAASHFWPQVCAVLDFLGTVWLTASLPFALANILFAARSARLAGQLPPRGGAHGYRQALIPSFMLALPLALFPWPVLGALLGRTIRALPWPSNPFLVAASLILVALVVGTVLYWTLYEARARRELAALLAKEVTLENTREDHSICPILERRVKDLLGEHVLMIDQDGIALELEPRYQWRYFFRLVPYFAPRDKTAFERDVERKLAAIPEDARVVVFVHGGLSDFRPNLPRAYARYRAMKADDARLHPIFVMWRSGLLLEVHGSLWLLEQAHSQSLVPVPELCRWLRVWPKLGRCLPPLELRRLSRLLGC